MSNQISPRKEMDLYLQNMLKLQFDASQIISHRPTQGDLREEFIKSLIKKEFSSVTLKKGILVKGDWQSSEADCILLQNNAREGNMRMYDLSDCRIFMEIKSRAKTVELAALNSTANELKSRNDNEEKITVGMFCYSTVAKDKTILSKFGFNYNEEIQGYNGYDFKDDLYPQIDFLFSLNITDEENKPYMITRDITNKCMLYQNNPLIECLLNYFR